jgi:hypothetical protein
MACALARPRKKPVCNQTTKGGQVKIFAWFLIFEYVTLWDSCVFGMQHVFPMSKTNLLLLDPPPTGLVVSHSNDNGDTMVSV